MTIATGRTLTDLCKLEPGTFFIRPAEPDTVYLYLEEIEERSDIVEDGPSGHRVLKVTSRETARGRARCEATVFVVEPTESSSGYRLGPYTTVEAVDVTLSAIPPTS